MTSFFREVLIDFLHSRVYLGLESVFSGEVFVFILWWSVVLDSRAAVFSRRAVGVLAMGHCIQSRRYNTE